jgi:mRNA-degrading endonuclease YafQ of YafQ-DinJ toxin-antitoxin module
LNRTLLRTDPFIRAAKRYIKKHPEKADKIQQALEQLAKDAFHPTLKTHKLKGEMEGSWACSAGHDLRIIFSFITHKDNEAILYKIHRNSQRSVLTQIYEKDAAKGANHYY